MSTMSERFHGAVGTADPATESAIVFTGPGAKVTWETLGPELGAGWFKERFLYLFGPGLEPLDDCLKAWSFLVPESRDRVILGRNAYGAIVFVDGMNAAKSRVYVVDPIEVQLIGERGMDFIRFFARYIPDDLLGPFLDDSVYRHFVEKKKLHLDPSLCLGIERPVSLGGKMELDNFRVENIVDYYEATGRIYAKAAKLST
ncbi:MAG: hypothetical protein ACXWUG_13405 [Polyangiales bacterium]